MSNNDVLRSLYFIFNLNEESLIKIFSLADRVISGDKICSWLKSEEDPEFISCSDEEILSCLDGLIYENRGKKEGVAPQRNQQLTNNLILKKVKIALSLKNEEVLSIFESVDIEMKEYEINAFFRKQDHKNYRKCKDKLLRNFLKGLQDKYYKA